MILICGNRRLPGGCSHVHIFFFWTSACLPSASTSNPPLLLAPFGLPPCIPLLQRPNRRIISSLLDFCLPPLHFNVQSTTPLLPFWTSSVLSSTSTSNPPLLSVPFGLQLASPPLQRPIHHATS